jgi:hypothetical protein
MYMGVRGEMGDGRGEMGNGRWEMGDGRWEMGDGKGEMSGCSFNICAFSSLAA